jgi:hypothetical protein
MDCLLRDTRGPFPIVGVLSGSPAERPRIDRHRGAPTRTLSMTMIMTVFADSVHRKADKVHRKSGDGSPRRRRGSHTTVLLDTRGQPSTHARTILDPNWTRLRPSLRCDVRW